MRFRVLKCTRCGAPVDFVDGAPAATCSTCGAEVVLDLALRESPADAKRYRNTTPVRPGMKAKLRGKDFEVIGRVVYSMEEESVTYYWEEFQLLAEDGDVYFLELDEGRWKLMQKFVPLAPIGPEEAAGKREGSTITLDRAQAIVTGVGLATIRFIEGELTYRAQVGDQIHYLDAKELNSLYSVEWTEDAIEFYRGTPLSERELYIAFDMKDRLQALERREKAGLSRGRLAGVCLVVSLLSFILWGISFGTGRVIAQGSVTVADVNREEGVRFGPYRLDPALRVYRLEINGEMRESSAWVAGVLESGEGEEVIGAQGDFWDESGADSDGYWHESDLSSRTEFLVRNPGPYYVRLYAESDTPSLAAAQRASFRLIGGVVYPTYLLIFAVLCLIVSIALFAAANPQAIKAVVESASDD